MIQTSSRVQPIESRPVNWSKKKTTSHRRSSDVAHIQRSHNVERTTTIPMKVVRSDSSDERERMNSFIREKFSAKECTCYIRKSDNGRSAAPGAKQPCFCGELEEVHEKFTPPTDRPSQTSWSEAFFKRIRPTNAYGQIEFGAEGVSNRKPTEYIRMCDEDSLEDVISFMLDYWKLKQVNQVEPSLCISIIGGAKNFRLEGHKKEVFHHGLIKAAQTTAAWLVTSGLNLGIVRVVGDALQEGKSIHFDKKQVSHELVCIGISPWGYVLERERLINKVADPKPYTVSNVIKSGEPVSLNANHTHYLFVDDGYRRRYGGSKSGEVRAQVEKKIATELRIPVVLVIVEGGPDVFDDAGNSIGERVPVVVCQGTGRAADIIAKAYQYRRRQERQFTHFPESEKEELMKMIKQSFESSKKPEETYTKLLKIVADEKYITVFDMNRSDDLDVSILYALIKASDSPDSQLKLALTWNRNDIAEQKIFMQNDAWSLEILENYMMDALKDDKVDFVRLLLQNGVGMKKFLTVARLRQLYNEASRRDVFLDTISSFLSRNNLPDPSVNIYLYHVAKLLQKIVGKYDNEFYVRDINGQSTMIEGKPLSQQTFPTPFKELFLWAVLHQRQTMAKFLWERTEEAIPLALVASRIYLRNRVKLPIYDTDGRIMFLANKDEFELLAAHVLDECYDMNKETATELIQRRNPTWGGYDCLELAASADCKKFLSAVPCQTSLDASWKMGMTAHPASIGFAVFCPPLVLSCLFEFSESHTDPEKLRVFYSAPITKFSINVLFYLAFLIFYSYTLLFQIVPDVVTIHEAFLMAYFIAIIIDIVREMFDSKADSPLERLQYWWSFSSWNRLDLFILIFSATSMLTRIATSASFTQSKSMYSVTAVLYYMRVLRLYAVHHKLGPKLVMIGGMIQELLIYILIIAVVVVGYGVATQSLMFPMRPFDWGILVNVVRYPYWRIYGEMNMDQANAVVSGCSWNTTTLDDGTYCPRYHWLVPLMLAVYLLIVNILLLNLLIAIFTNVFNSVEENSIEIWKFNMYFLVVEYMRKPYLPIPLSFAENIVSLCRFVFWCCTLWCKCANPQNTDDSMADSKEQTFRELHHFESSCKATQLVTMREMENRSTERRLEGLGKRLDEMFTSVEDLHTEVSKWKVVHSSMEKIITKWNIPDKSSDRPTSATSSFAREGTEQEIPTTGDQLDRDKGKNLVTVAEASDEDNVLGRSGSSGKNLRLDKVIRMDSMGEIAPNDLSKGPMGYAGFSGPVITETVISKLSEMYERQLRAMENRFELHLRELEDKLKSTIATSFTADLHRQEAKLKQQRKRLREVEERVSIVESTTTSSLYNIGSTLRQQQQQEQQPDQGQGHEEGQQQQARRRHRSTSRHHQQPDPRNMDV